MQDRIHEGFLRRQYEDVRVLERESDLLEVSALPGDPPARYIVALRCKGLIRADDRIREHDTWEFGVSFPPDYLRRADPFEVVTLLNPLLTAWHPNISSKAPIVCIGRLTPGTGLVDIVYQVFEVVTYNKVTMREDDALNVEACAWARRNQHRFPIDRRPLKRRTLRAAITVSEGVASAPARGDGE